MKFSNGLLFVFICCMAGCTPDLKTSALAPHSKSADLTSPEQHLVYQWAEIALEATARDTERFTPRPTVTSRCLALIWTAIFDAWSRYDTTATPVYAKEISRRPVSEHTARNKEIAISYAARTALLEYFPADAALFDSFMILQGFEVVHPAQDSSTPEGIGMLAAQKVIEARKHDGSNQYGDAPGSDSRPYFDYTGYTAVNSADQAIDLMRWQPKYFSDGKGGRFAPGCLTPFWHKVKPMAIVSADQFRSPPPPASGSGELKREVKEVVDVQATLTPEQKAMVEFMRDGPASVQQAGHWLQFAMNVSIRDKHTLDQDVKLFFLTTVTAMDAFIACWDTKMYYDFARPYALVRHYYAGKEIFGWSGPEQGWRQMQGEKWRPYSPDEFLCPAFPAYVSGHSTVSGGCAEVLRLFTGDDAFGEKIEWVPGHLTEPDNVDDAVTLRLETFSGTAEMAGLSRVLGGYHIQADNIEGLILGRKVGQAVYAWYLTHTE